MGRRLGRCASIITGEDGDLPRVKPFKYCYEKEIVLYAYYKRLDYFSTECIYAPFAARGYAREFIKDLEVGTDQGTGAGWLCCDGAAGGLCSRRVWYAKQPEVPACITGVAATAASALPLRCLCAAPRPASSCQAGMS